MLAVSGKPDPLTDAIIKSTSVQTKLYTSTHTARSRAPQVESTWTRSRALQVQAVTGLSDPPRWPVCWISSTPPASTSTRAGAPGSSSWTSASNSASMSRTPRRSDLIGPRHGLGGDSYYCSNRWRKDQMGCSNRWRRDQMGCSNRWRRDRL